VTSSSRIGRGWAAGLILFLLFSASPAQALDGQGGGERLMEAVAYLCSEVADGQMPDPDRIAPVIEHVRTHPDSATTVPKFQGAPGAYMGFPIRMPLQRLLRYLYNPSIPQEVLKPFSIRSSVWTGPEPGRAQAGLWAAPWPPAAPVVIRGRQRDRTTPDPATGGCYGMTLQRVIILLPGKRAVLSVSVQDGDSDVGTKGYALGPESEGYYVYSGEKGLTRTGLGWVSSRIQTNVSIGVYLEGEDGGVTSGVFQWMRAGWSGLSVIRESHIASSLTRYKTLFTARLAGLPAPERLEEMYAGTAGRSEAELRSLARGVFTRWLDLFGDQAPREAVALLQDGYAERLDPGELVALGMREGLSASAQALSAASGAQTSWLAPTLFFQPLRTSR